MEAFTFIVPRCKEEAVNNFIDSLDFEQTNIIDINIQATRHGTDTIYHIAYELIKEDE